MLAARDQENLVFNRQASAALKQSGPASRQTQSKTIGAKYPKTPLRVPLNDENANTFAAGKSGLAQKTGRTASKLGNKSALATPLEPRTRAVLGDKTTNAKARTVQTVGVKNIVREIEKTQAKPATTNRPKKAAPQAEPAKIEIHTDKATPVDEEEDVEYAPPRVKDVPYESDVFQADALDLEGLKPENQLRGYYEFYYNPRDDNGVSLRQKKMDAQREKFWKDTDAQMRKDFENMDWSVSDVPGSENYFTKKQHQPGAANGLETAAPLKPGRLGTKPPSTIAARKAASALSGTSGTTTRPALGQNISKPAPTKSFLLGKTSNRPVTLRTSSADRATAVTASRSTLGYTKGRTAQSVVHGRTNSHSQREGLQRSTSTASTESSTTITPAKYAQSEGTKRTVDDELNKLEFLSIFDVGEDDDHFGVSDDVLFAQDSQEDDVELKLEFD